MRVNLLINNIYGISTYSDILLDKLSRSYVTLHAQSLPKNTFVDAELLQVSKE